VLRFSSDGAWTYIQCSVAAYQTRLITGRELATRMRFVRDFSDPYSLEILAASELIRGEDEPDKWDDEDPRETIRTTEGGESHLEIQVSAEGTTIIMQLIPNSATGLNNWMFHQADADPFPSIPHGHHFQSTEKLDAYRGHIVQGNSAVGREPRWKIVALWNDENFRSFARAAIHWYSATFPKYVWPAHIRGRQHVLPKKRRP
jgi:hypothetical protein